MKVFYILPFIFLSGCANTPEQQMKMRQIGLALREAGHELQGNGQYIPPSEGDTLQPQIINPSVPACAYRYRC